MTRLVEYLNGQQLVVGEVTVQDEKKLVVSDERGRSSRLAADKVLFSHSAGSREELESRLGSLQQEVDVPLLWETLMSEQDTAGREASELARLYFDADSPAHSSAVFRALSAERVHFRRKGRAFEPRTPEDLEALVRQRDVEARTAAEQAALEDAVRRQKVDGELAGRLERFVRGAEDKVLRAALEAVAKNPERHAFGLLVGSGHLPRTADLEVLQANLRPELPDPVVAHAAGLELPPVTEEVRPAAFTIDDPDTREVDDALSATVDGDLLRVDVDIADVATLVRAGDPVDQEAHRRAATVYLPTRTYQMLPQRLGCDLLSLTAGEVRRSMRTSVWVDRSGRVQRYSLERVPVRVARRLDYDEADRLLEADGGGDEVGATLRLLREAAAGLAAWRREHGALSFRQREWKIRVAEDGESIEAKLIPFRSASRALVAEMMILANRLAARLAAEQQLPLIYRVQPPPAERPADLDPDDPTTFARMRGLLQPAALSLQPGRHWGLGLEQYTQTTSPLRRYADLVLQRQIHAVLAGSDPPYAAPDLMRVLASAEATERENKRLEAAVTTRWALEYLTRLEDPTDLQAWILGEAPGGGYRVEMAACGAQGVLQDSRPREIGDLVRVKIKTLRPRQGTLRVLPAA